MSDFPPLIASMEARGPLTKEEIAGWPEALRRRSEAEALYRQEHPKPRMMLSDQAKRDLVSLGIDPAEAYDLIEPITWSELMEDNPLDDETIE